MANSEPVSEEFRGMWPKNTTFSAAPKDSPSKPDPAPAPTMQRPAVDLGLIQQRCLDRGQSIIDYAVEAAGE